jgi:hypothetical protein
VKLVVGVYVDDLIITGLDHDDIMSFKEEMADAFKMSDLGLLHYYLGIKVKQSASGISLSQGAYVMKILDRSGMTGCNVSCTHGGLLEAEQAKHVAASGRYNISEHRRKLEVFDEYSSQSCIFYWLCESFSGGATRGSPCSSEEDSPLCCGYLQLGALVRPEERKSCIVNRVQ